MRNKELGRRGKTTEIKKAEGAEIDRDRDRKEWDEEMTLAKIPKDAKIGAIGAFPLCAFVPLCLCAISPRRESFPFFCLDN